MKYKSGYKYQLYTTEIFTTGIIGYEISNQFCTLDWKGNLKVRQGYAYDGPTCAIHTKTFMRGSLAHDALCQFIREGQLPESARKPADNVLILICKQDGMCAVRRWWVRKGVHLGKFIAQKKREILEAP